MPTIRPFGPEARARLAIRGRSQLQPYLEAIPSLSGEQTLELEPEQGETLRMIALRAHSAARQLGKPIACGTTQEGSVLLWLEEQPTRRRRRRRRVSGEEASAAGAALG